MFTLGFFVGIVLSPFGAGVTLMMYHVRMKTLLNQRQLDSTLLMGYPAYDIFHAVGFDLRIVGMPISF
jgi:hypothetical protein